MSSTTMNRAARIHADNAVDRIETEPGLWLFLTAPASFVLTLLVIGYLSLSSF